jgi:hypothetical protein
VAGTTIVSGSRCRIDGATDPASGVPADGADHGLDTPKPVTTEAVGDLVTTIEHSAAIRRGSAR